MTNAPRGQMVDLDGWDFGDVVAVVDQPEAFPAPEPTWQKVAVEAFVAGLSAGFVVPLVSLAWKGLRSGGSSPHVALIALEDARQLMKRDLLFFPESGPNVGDVYARHPLRRRDYMPYAGFHRLVLNEKSIEATRYLLSLGARDVEITWRESIGKAAKAEGGIGLPNVEDVSLTMGLGRDDSGKLAIRIAGAGKAKPLLDDLIWPDRDPMFKLMRTAADAGAEQFHFGIKTEQSTSVNAGAALQLQDLGFSLGGEYKRWEDLAFTVDATFAPAQ
ncbi:protein of unknown function [Modestobacter italicus]|uniref:Uncharacterized protein n=1 Tax=Modestobacter italicus (strain DSM 44449 / CECT 9708 / BC 501) TaxID=2732864 RepID=I4F1L6_MODI5|nr:hypothetical protein [Modestobacter marinus]CCH89529.1 protein of unknown function [Modestobacter marinus]